jgi:hypothetical protein
VAKNPLFCAAIVLGLFASRTYGQLTFTAASYGSGSQAVTTFGGPTVTATAGAGSESLNMKVDWNWQQTAGGTYGTHLDAASISFTVGPLPVQISNLQFVQNVKWVNGGGSASAPVTTWSGEGLVVQGGLGLNPTVLAAPNATGTLTGNGYTIANDTKTASGSYVLANGVTYTLRDYVYTNVDPSALTSNDPTSVVTLEAGGVSTWPGFTASFNWQTVPEPATLSLLAPLPLMLMRRRKRSVL